MPPTPCKIQKQQPLPQPSSITPNQQSQSRSKSNTTRQTIKKLDTIKESSKDIATTTTKSKSSEETKSFSSNNNNNGGGDGNISKAVPLTNGIGATTNETVTLVQKMPNLAQFRITEPIDVLIQKVLRILFNTFTI